MSLEPPAILQSLQNHVRQRPISWEGAVRAKTITDADLKKIKAVDKVRKEQRRQTIESDTDTYKTLLLGDGGENKSIFETTAKRTDILQYMLVLLSDLIDDVPQLRDELIKHAHPFKPLLPLLKQSSNPEDTIPLLTSAVLSSLISYAYTTSPKGNAELDDALPKLNTYIAELLKSSDSNLQDIACQEFSAVLCSSKSRQQFWKQREVTLSPLFNILRSTVGDKDTESTFGGSTVASLRSDTASTFKIGGSVGLQLLYHVLLVIWQLSFEGRLVGKGLDEDYDIVPLYTRLLRVSPKEKTTRLLLSTLKNLLEANKTTLMPAAIPCRLPAVLGVLKTRQLPDQDLKEDLDILVDMLNEYTSSQTTLDEYTSELDSGHLRWSPVHRDADFWHENAKTIIEREDGSLCRKLAEILSKDWSSDKQVLAIGCNDVAALVKECPEMRHRLEKLGLKARVMSLMQDENEHVRWESLRAVGEWLRYSFDKSA